MKCANCGNELQNNAVFCEICGRRVQIPKSNHGTTFCGYCGAKADISERFCGECGKPLAVTPRPAPAPSPARPAKNNTITVIIILLIVLLVIVAGVLGYLWYRNYSITPSQTQDVSIQTTSPIPEDNVSLVTYYVVNCYDSISLRTSPSTSASVIKSIPLGAPVSYVSASTNGFAKVIYNGTTGFALQSYLSTQPPQMQKVPATPLPESNSNQITQNAPVSSPSYRIYNNYEFNFSCAYPAHFTPYTDSDPFVKYALKAPDNSAILKICATKNPANLTVNDVLNNFKSSYPGTVDYQNSGNTWCAISTIKDGQDHYGYFHVGSDSIIGFEMHSDRTYYSIYEQYINYIYDSLDFN